MNCKVVVSVIVTLLFATGLIFGIGAEEAKAIKCPGKVNVLVKEVIPSSFVQYNKVKATLLPAKVQSLVSATASVVVKIQANVGAPVKAGDAILSLDDKAIQEEISKIKQDIKKTEKTLAKKSTTKAAKKEAEANLKQSQEVLAQKEQQLQNCTFSAAFDGILGALNVKEGDHISEGFVMGFVINASQVVAPVPAAEAEKLNAGQTLKVEIPQLNKTIDGTVQKSDQTYILMDNSDNQIQKDMTAAFMVPVKQFSDVVALSENMILKDEAGSYVYTVNGKLAKKTSIKTGPEAKGMVLVVEGLNSGDEVITTEVQNPKKGLLNDTLSCLADNKKIIVMEKNEATGQYSERKITAKETATAPAKEIEVKKEKKHVYPETPRKNAKIRIGLNFHYFKMNSNFDEVYGQLPGYGIDLSYTLSKSLDVWLVANYGSKTATLEAFADSDMEFKFIPVSLDLRYFFKRGQKIDIYAGAGFTYYAFKDVSPLNDITSNAIGINLVGGTYYHFNDHVALQLALRWSTAKKDVDLQPSPDYKLDLSGLDLMLGISYGF